MSSSAAGKPLALSETQVIAPGNALSSTRKVWLPGVVYSALPYFYFIAGIAAFLATLYVHEWFWVLPHSLLFSAGCLHLSVYVFRRRHAAKHRSRSENE